MTEPANTDVILCSVAFKLVIMITRHTYFHYNTSGGGVCWSPSLLLSLASPTDTCRIRFLIRDYYTSWNTLEDKVKIMIQMKHYLKGREMRTVVKDKQSEWREVKSGVPQGSVLAPIMFLIHVNDMTGVTGVSSYISLFADDAKLLRKIRNHKDCEELQNDINKIYEWSKTWEMQFNAKKYHVLLDMGKDAMRPSWTYKLGENIISIAKEEKDLGVYVSVYT